MFAFTVKPDGGEPFQVTAGARDVLAWEKTNRGKTFKTLTETLSMVDLYRLAHVTCRRAGLFTGDLAEFEETCELDWGEQDQQEPDPTHPAP
jgi:hypothetical protein